LGQSQNIFVSAGFTLKPPAVCDEVLHYAFILRKNTEIVKESALMIDELLFLGYFIGNKIVLFKE